MRPYLNHRHLNAFISSPILRCISSNNHRLRSDEIQSWTRLLRDLLHQGKAKEVLQAYHQRQFSPSDLSVQTYSILFKAYIQTKSWSEGHQLYTQIRTNRTFSDDQRLRIIVLNMYSKAGDFPRAEEILSDLLTTLSECSNPQHIDPTAFSILMTGYNLHRQSEKTLRTFDRVQNPDTISFLLAFQACSRLKDGQEGERLMRQLTQSKIDLRKEMKLQTAIFDMYGKCGDVTNAEKIFAMIEHPTIIHYNSLFKVYNDKKMYNNTWQLFEKLQEHSIDLKPDPITFSCLFHSVAKKGDLEHCRRLMKAFNTSGISLNQHPILQVNLINAFGKCGDLITSQKIFDQIREPRITGVYNALMKAYNSIQTPLTTLSIFDRIPKPDAISYLIAIQACAQIAMLRRARRLYEQISHQFPSYKDDHRIMNALIDMFGKCGDVNTARQLFDAIEKKDLISYNTLINSYGLNGDGLAALNIYHSLLSNSSLTVNEQTYSIILNACSHSALVNEAERIFQSIPNDHRNVFVYATMIDTFCRASKVNEARVLLSEYEQTNPKYPPMYITLLTAYARLKDFNQVKEIHRLIGEYFPDHYEYLSSSTILLANTHAFSGNLDEAIRLRTSLAEQNQIYGIKKVPGISWTETNDGQIHEFIAHDRRHERSEEIYEELKRISNEIDQDGHQSDHRWVTSNRLFNCNLDPLHSHSERLALAYQLFLRSIDGPTHLPIQITKNLRICGDCHEVFKRMTHIRPGLVILARDRTRQHLFQQGVCSCNDYF